MANVADLLTGTASNWPNRTAIVAGSTRMNWAEVDYASNRVANALTGLGVKHGDRVALMSANRPEFTIAYFGILKVGAIVVPLNTMLKESEVTYHLRDSGAVLLLAVGEVAGSAIETIAQQAQHQANDCRGVLLLDSPTYRQLSADQSDRFDTAGVDDEDTAVILYTSGTTGRPKGAELRHRNIRDNALTGGALFEVDVNVPDVFLCALPLFHSFGQSGMQNTAVAFGGTLVMMPRFDAAEALKLMATEHVSYFGGVPTMFWKLVEASSGVDLRLRVALAGGAPLAVELHERFRRTFGITILEGYGLSETSPLACSARPHERLRIGSIGAAVPGVEMKLVDPDGADLPENPESIGEIAIRGHNVMKGYFRRPEATAAVLSQGWLRTGDLGRRDEDGFYYIVDRRGDMILRGGFNVYPRELEELLMTHRGVSLVAVVGVPDDVLGQEIKAVIVPTAGTDVQAGEIIAWTKERVAAYKYPRIVEFRDELPLTSTGKILKRAI